VAAAAAAEAAAAAAVELLAGAGGVAVPPPAVLPVPKQLYLRVSAQVCAQVRVCDACMPCVEQPKLTAHALTSGSWPLQRAREPPG